MNQFNFIVLLLFVLTGTKLNAQNNTTITPTQNNTSPSNSNLNTTTTTTATTTAAASSNTTLTTVATTTAGNTTTTTTTTDPPTTTTADLCSTNSSYCNYNGNCTYDDKKDRVCKCNSNFYGQYCQQTLCANDVVENQCLNNATCLKDIFTSKKLCVCTPDYTGALCEKPKCIGLCYNDGVCEYDKLNSTRVCRCLDRFYGEYCQFDSCFTMKDTCSKNCYLFKSLKSTQCECACNDKCDEAFCNKRGKCDYKQAKLVCNCNIGYSGPQCATDDCRSQCFNNGTCLRNDSNTLTCKCTPEYTGARCEQKYTPVKKSIGAGRVFAYILVFALIICLVALIIFTYRRGGFDCVREKFDNLSYRIRTTYERAPQQSSINSHVPYNPQVNKPEDSYADPFS